MLLRSLKAHDYSRDLSSCKLALSVTTIELVVTTIESVRDSLSQMKLSKLLSLFLWSFHDRVSTSLL